MTIDAGAARTQIEQTFADSIVPTLVEYIGIPNKSPMFDPKWREHGHMQRAVDLLAGWAKAHLPPGATLEVVQVEDRTPVIFIEVPGTARDGDTVLMYGHLDKQPEMTGWDDGLGPWLPVMRGERLYGRGGADDGYAIFASLTALNVLAEQGRPYARCCVLIEACEESGSFDLPAYIEHLAPRIGTPSLVVCLDSGCGNYDQLWCTTSLRGLVLGTLEVSLLREGVHSGDGSGVVASSFRVVRALLDRLEDAGSGAIKLEELYATIPRGRIEQASRAADVLGDEVWSKFPLQPGVRPVHADAAELILNRTWRPALSVTGAEGLPPIGNAGNVLRPTTAIKLSLRVPPTVDAAAALARVKELLEANPPYGAKVTLHAGRRQRRVERPGPGAVAGGRARGRVGHPLRQAAGVDGRRRLDPVHGHAGSALPRGAVLHHRRARAGLERPRPQRVPRSADGQEADRVRGRRDRASRDALTDDDRADRVGLRRDRGGGDDRATCGRPSATE
jgi:acetylornithine deacetylase/succinyl-diaminopimelate desuccinylase-like protein